MGIADRMEEVEHRKRIVELWQDTNQLLYFIAQALAGTPQGAEALFGDEAKTMGRRRVSGVRSAGGDGGIAVQRFPLGDDAWIIARRHPNGDEDVFLEDGKGNRRELTPDEAEAFLNG